MLIDYKPHPSEDFIAKERFDISKLEKCGQGSDRIVYRVNAEYVVKIAKTARGLAQNDLEGDNFLDFIPKLIERGMDYVVVEYVARDDKRSNKMLKPLKEFSCIDFKKDKSKMWEVFDKIGTDYNCDSFVDSLNYDLLFNDFKAGRNWGWKDDKPYHVDAGTLSDGILNVNDYHKHDWEIIKTKRRATK